MTNQVRRGGSRHAPIRMGGRLPAGGRLRGQPRADRRRGHLVERRGTGRGRHVGLRRQAGCAPGPAGRRAHGLPRPGRGRGHGLAPVRAAGHRCTKIGSTAPGGTGRFRTRAATAWVSASATRWWTCGEPPSRTRPSARPGPPRGTCTCRQATCRPPWRRCTAAALAAATQRETGAPLPVGCGSAHPHRPDLGLFDSALWDEGLAAAARGLALAPRRAGAARWCAVCCWPTRAATRRRWPPPQPCPPVRYPLHDFIFGGFRSRTRPSPPTGSARRSACPGGRRTPCTPWATSTSTPPAACCRSRRATGATPG